ncbi:hypothetical protein ACF8OI_18430 [Aeromonas bivalvium]|uniref:hypothetical protein n=1 Tax=Aeromonas bivalvium TaxID=440079 RepID=UPI00370C5A04
MIENIKGVIISRMNNILIGSFFISAIMMNFRGILIFIYSEKAEKINILKNWQLNISYDILIPLILAIFYITAVPLLSSLFKKHIANKIYEKEHEAERERLFISYQGMSEVAIAAAESTPENADLIVKKRVQDWIAERDETLMKLDSYENHNNELQKSVDSLQSGHYIYKESVSYYSELYGRAIKTINDLSTSIYELNTSPPGLIFRNNTDAIEYKEYVVLHITKQINNMIECVNNEPSRKNPMNGNGNYDWEPPIDKHIQLTFSKNIAEMTEKMTLSSETKKSVSVKGSD